MENIISDDPRNETRILIVDDADRYLKQFKSALDSQYLVDITTDPYKALVLLKMNNYDLIIADYHMPLLTGIDLLERCLQIDSDMVRILTTAHPDREGWVRAINNDHIYKVILKPCNDDHIRRTVQEAIKVYRTKEIERKVLEETLKGSVKMLIDLLSLSEINNFTNIPNFRLLAKELAKEDRYEHLWEIEIAALLCKVGYIGIDNELIEKYLIQENFKPKDFVQYQSHTKIAHELLSNIPRLRRIADGILYQYERWDGKGPYNLKAKEIPYISRVLSIICDFFIYSNTTGDSVRAIEKMMQTNGKYDPHILSMMIYKTIGEVNMPTRDDYKLVVDISKIGGIKHKTKGIFYHAEELNEGLKLADDVKDNYGLNLVSKGTVLTGEIIKYLKLKASSHQIPNSILIEDNTRDLGKKRDNL